MKPVRKISIIKISQFGNNKLVKVWQKTHQPPSIRAQFYSNTTALMTYLWIIEYYPRIYSVSDFLVVLKARHISEPSSCRHPTDIHPGNTFNNYMWLLYRKQQITFSWYKRSRFGRLHNHLLNILLKDGIHLYFCIDTTEMILLVSSTFVSFLFVHEGEWVRKRMQYLYVYYTSILAFALEEHQLYKNNYYRLL